MVVDKSRTTLVSQTISRTWMAGDQVDVLRNAARWLESAALRRLTAALGEPSRPTQDLQALVKWSARILDTRGGAERRDTIPTTGTKTRFEGCYRLRGALGLLKTADPCRASYEVAVLLGGATTGNRLRTALARDLASRGVDLGTGMRIPLTAWRSFSTGSHWCSGVT